MAWHISIIHKKGLFIIYGKDLFRTYFRIRSLWRRTSSFRQIWHQERILNRLFFPTICFVWSVRKLSVREMLPQAELTQENGFAPLFKTSFTEYCIARVINYEKDRGLFSLCIKLSLKNCATFLWWDCEKSTNLSFLWYNDCNSLKLRTAMRSGSGQ